MTGTVVQLSSRAPRCDWPGLTGQGGFMSDRAVCGRFRVSVRALQKRTLGYYLPNVTIAESCRSTSPHKHDML